MDSLLNDLRYAFRTLRRAPGFALVAILTLALGIGANSGIFSVVSGVLLQPLPFADPDRLVVVWGDHPTIGHETASYPDFEDWRRDNTVFTSLAGVTNAGDNFSVPGGEAVRVRSARVTVNFFSTLGVTMAHGRGFVPEEERFGTHQVAVISHGLWQRVFGGSPSVVGRTVTMNGNQFQIIGVAPASMTQPEGAELWTPLAFNPANPPPGRRSDFLFVIGRLKPSATIDQAKTEMKAIMSRLAQQYPRTNAQWSADVVPLHEELVGDARPALLIFAGAVGLVLLIACANVANLMLARAAAREREVAIRLAMGAPRGRIVRQLLTESVVLSILGGAAGVLLAVWFVASMQTLQLNQIPRLDEVRVDGLVLLFTFGLSVLTGLLFGLAPALRLTRPELQGALKEGGRGSIGGSGVDRIRGALVLSQVALALLLLVGAGLLIRSFQRMLEVDPGFNPERLITFQLTMPSRSYPEVEQLLNAQRAVRERVAALPGVRSVGITSDLPFASGYGYIAFAIEGQQPLEPGVVQDMVLIAANNDYFKTMGIPLRRGELFSGKEPIDTLTVAVVNEALVQKFFKGRDPIGARVTLGNPEDGQWATIVGVVGNTLLDSPSKEPYPQMFFADHQLTQRQMSFAVRTSGDPGATAAAIRRAVAEVDPTLPVAALRTMDESFSNAMARPRVNLTLLGVFAAVAVLLAAIGIYGVVSYAVAQRTRELGIRVALGASAHDVLGLVVRQGMTPVAIGVLLGLLAAFAATRVMRSLLYGVGATDPVTLASVTVLLALIAFFASWIPARRATRVDPMVALRSE
ncbi:MAG TPA: ABC transporter permease [Gemmatimonadaceae bacterium]|nr:ABC transporter permease [Gemmatimonadaceae bacterium]